MKFRTGKTMESRGEALITCRELITHLLEYLARELTPDEEHEFERHLILCPSCLAYLETYKEAVHLARETLRQESDARPPELGGELVRTILHARP